MIKITSSEIKEKIRYWILPAGIIDLCVEIKTIFDLKSQALCRPNSRFKGIHQGERCFILCNGPSINRQNLLPLKNEIVISVSNGYHHKDYLTIQPKYHCVPSITYTALMQTKDAENWFKEMDAGIGTSELFLSAAEEPLVSKKGLFPGRKINYIHFGLVPKKNHKKIIDISRRVPAVITVPILGMMIAMYMGVKEIYLLGVDNDWWKTGEYKYFYEPTVLKGKIIDVHENGKVKTPLYQQVLGYGKVSMQYWVMHNIARANNISIFNATEGGALEEFERVKFESLF